MARVKISLKDKGACDTRTEGEATKGVEPVKTDIPPDSEDWDEICNRCGKCCFDKIVDEDDKLIAMTACVYLDSETGLCKEYERRFLFEKDCLKLTPENLNKFDWLPDDCGYVTYFKLREKKGEKGEDS